MVLPRWRPWRVSERTGELGGLRISQGLLDQVVTDESASEQIASRIIDYDHRHGLHEATDLVGTALVLGREADERVRTAAAELANASSEVARNLSNAVLGIAGRQADHAEAPTMSRSVTMLRIRKLKEIVERDPRNALAWVDLALAQTVLGNVAAAEQPIRISLAQAKGNRFVLRAAARFYVVQDDIDRAHQVLTADSDLLVNDPWLLAAEIAITDLNNESPRFIRHARRLLDASFYPHDLSELASALATVELAAGRTKIARRLLSRALIDPTDNALAQAEWSANRGVDIVAPGQLEGVLRGFEARARHHGRSREFDLAVREGVRWQDDQPFALDPALFVSFIAATFTEDFEAAINACKVGLISSPRNPRLLNNLAFAEASAGQTSSARTVLARPMDAPSERDRAVQMATRGLIEFREGNIDSGRSFYRHAINELRPAHPAAAALAAMYWAYEEYLVSGDPISVITDADKLGSAALRDADVLLVRGRLNRFG